MKCITTSLCLLFCFHFSFTQEISVEETETIITTLASDEFEGRYTGSTGYDQSAEYLISILEDNCFQPLFEEYTDAFKGEKNVDTYNIVAINQDYDHTKKTIIFSGHLDHMGKIKRGKDKIMNGANDNASGVTAALQIGTYLCQLETIDENIIVAFYSGEEQGLLGSYHLAAKMKESKMNVDVVYNFEMIGKTLTDQPNTVYVTGYEMSNMADAINEEAERELVIFFGGAKELELFYRSDNYPFYEQFNIPAQTFSSFDFTNYDYYHHVDDEVEELDIENMNDIINSLANSIETLLIEDTEISLKE